MLERRRSFTGFIRFVAGCDAVINLSAVSVLGRNSFIAAALGKPGIFTSNVELNTRLYPDALVKAPDDATLRGKVRGLLRELLTNAHDNRFLPDEQAARAAGDHAANAQTFRGILGV